MDSIDRFRHWSYKSPVNVKWLGVCCCQIGFNLIFIHHSVVSVLYAIPAVSSLTVKTCIVSFAINQKLITHTHTHTHLFILLLFPITSMFPTAPKTNPTCQPHVLFPPPQFISVTRLFPLPLPTPHVPPLSSYLMWQGLFPGIMRLKERLTLYYYTCLTPCYLLCEGVQRLTSDAQICMPLQLF